MKTKLILLLVLLFIVINTSTYYITKINLNKITDIILNENFITLDTHYKVLLESQKKIALAVNQSTANTKRVAQILAEAKDSSIKRQAELRIELHNLLLEKYTKIKELGVLQYHFIFPDNISFYRAHKPSKYGDDLTGIRADFEYVNRTQKSIRGFTQGRTAHGFRNVFPLFDENNNYIAAMEVSFSSDNFQWYLNNISHIHSHFIVDKKIFDANAWLRDDLVLQYVQSVENKKYMLSIETMHKEENFIDKKRLEVEKLREKFYLKMNLGKAFSMYIENENDDITMISFLAISNLQKEVVAWIVSYKKSPIIKSTLFITLIARIIIFFFSLLVIYLIVKQMIARQRLKKQHDLLDDILNTTDNPMILTDCKEVKMSNEAFESLIDRSNINTLNEHPFLDIFMSQDGYMHRGLLKENEKFIELIQRTFPENRLVSILDKHLEVKAFKIDIVKTKNNGDYLITLSDITEMQEHHNTIEQKAYIDGLTGVYNRNKFDELFKEEFKSVQRYNNSLSIAIIDIDKFKNFNDKYGHLIGDEVLIQMAQTVNNNVRDTDIFARWGGEEFVILFKNTSLSTAKEVSLKLKHMIQRHEHPSAGKITASFGLTEYRDGDSLESIFKRCDEALYIAKENGRDRVEIL